MARRDKSSDTDAATPAKKGRLRQIGEAYSMTRKADRWVGYVVFAYFMLGWGAVVAVGVIVEQALYFAIIGFPVGIILALVMFGRRVERAAYAQVEGQPGAAAAVVQGVRGWTMTPGVAANKQQDLVSRAVGRPGIVLIGEGDPIRVRSLMSNERKRMTRFVPDAPVTEIIIGEGEGLVPLRKVQRTVQKLPRTLKPAEVTEVRRRLGALGGLMEQMPIPKGPMPKGGRVPRGKMR